jgi:hypothetical protein
MKVVCRNRSVLAIACSLLFGLSALGQAPAVGAKAPDFTLAERIA